MVCGCWCYGPFWSSRRGTVCVGGHHVPPSLGNSPAVLFGRALKPALSPLVVSIKCKHSLHVIRQLLKDPCTESPLEVPLMAAVGLLVGPEMVLKVSFWPGVSVLTVDVKVFEHVIKVEIEGLVEILASTSHAFAGGSTMFQMVILSSPFLIRQGFICWKKTGGEESLDCLVQNNIIRQWPETANVQKACVHFIAKIKFLRLFSKVKIHIISLCFNYWIA